MKKAVYPEQAHYLKSLHANKHARYTHTLQPVRKVLHANESRLPIHLDILTSQDFRILLHC